MRLRNPSDNLLSTSGTQILVLGREVVIHSSLRVSQFNGRTASDWFVCNKEEEEEDVEANESMIHRLRVAKGIQNGA